MNANMTPLQQQLLDCVDTYLDELFAIACDIFDHPEIGGEEVYANKRLTSYLEAKGFQIEQSVGGMETSFRATWERGEGGPSIGYLLEYDALRNMGHACGHHLQGPVCIGAALALRETCDKPFKLVLYGTPDEENRGGKITMEKNGCFRDVDVMFSHHTGSKTNISGPNYALAPIRVTFHGTPAHAAGSPHKGRSALDAMMLAFHGLEIMREHVKDGCRIHYTILEGTGPSNIVPATAKTHITLRSRDKHYLEDMRMRMLNIVKGACLMTETTAEIEERDVYWNKLTIPSLIDTTLAMAELVQADKLDKSIVPGGGSTDVGNVSWVTPTVLINTYFCDAGAHTVEYMEEGKTENARRSLETGAKIIGLTAMEMVLNKDLFAKVKEEHIEAVKPVE